MDLILYEAAARCKNVLVTPFVRAVEKLTNALVKTPTFAYPHWVLFRWSCQVILGAKAGALESPMLGSLLQCMAELLEVLSQARNKSLFTTSQTIYTRIFKSVCVLIFVCEVILCVDTRGE